MKKITLFGGKQAEISDCDLYFLAGFSFDLGKDGYARCNAKPFKNKLLHIMVAKRMGLDTDKYEIDHTDDNKLNNQRENLREVTRSQQMQSRPARRHNQLGIKGVYQRKNGTFRARIDANGVHHNLGDYLTKEAAAYAYKLAAEKYHGEFAHA